ncbi:MAG TPA: ATP-binding protein [Nitrospirota bacterium]|nr:ATP-binding protein [Nitrospirota bacterium]
MKFKSLRTRITVWTLAAMVLIPVIVGMVIIVKQFALARQFSQTIEESDRIFKDTLLRDLEHAMMVNQLDGVRSVLGKFGGYEGVKGVTLMDARGSTVLSFGKILGRWPDGKQLDQLLAGGREISVYAREGADPVRTLALPILNKPACMPCHIGGAVNGLLLIRQRSVDVRSETNFLVVIMLISLLIATLAAALTLLVLLTRKVVDPIRELSSATERIGHCELDVRVPVHGDDEVGELAQSFNRMITDLKRSRDEVEERSLQTQQAYQSMQAAQKKLIQSEKLAAIGTLVAGIAHEINNPVGIIAARTDCMLMESKENGVGGQFTDDLMVINRQAGRIASITRSLLTFARQAPAQLNPVDVNAVVEDTLYLVSKQFIKEGITIERHLSPKRPTATADGNQLQQVLLDLLNNARDAMPGGGTIIVATANSADKVEITLADTGEGIPEDVLDNIFDPFFTTKEVGKGTGLGLAVSYGIIQGFGGNIEVLSRPGEGSKFNITLPRIREVA